MTKTETIHLYKHNEELIHLYFKNEFLPLIKSTNTPFEKILHSDGALFKIYSIDKKTYKQNSASYFKNKKLKEEEGRDFEYFFSNFDYSDSRINVTNCLINESDDLNIKLIVYNKKEDSYVVFSFDLLKLLKEHKLLNNLAFNAGRYIKGVYMFFSAILSLVALYLASASIISWYDYLTLNDTNNAVNYKHLFHGIISLTLGLAIFDLAKAIFENEVINRKPLDKDHTLEPRILTNFVGSIIIALLIESLLLVFKSVLNDFENFQNSLLLIMATGFLILILASFNLMNAKSKWYKKTCGKKNKCENER